MNICNSGSIEGVAVADLSFLRIVSGRTQARLRAGRIAGPVVGIPVGVAHKQRVFLVGRHVSPNIELRLVTLVGRRGRKVVTR